ncbi:type VII secretion target [Glycomyces sp. NPDC047369]
MTWINVDAEKLRQAAAALHESEGEIQALADYAKEADPEWWMWGVAGLVMAPAYFALAEYFHSAVTDSVDAVSGLADRIQACADEHDGNDAAIAAELARIGGDLKGGK